MDLPPGSMSNVRRAWVWWTLLAFIFAPSLAAAAQRDVRAFTVRDSIGMTAVAVPDPSMASYLDFAVPISPDGRKVLIVTRTGDLKRGCNDFGLSVYEIEDIRVSMTAPDLPPSRELARFCTASNRPGIAQLVWSSMHTITFIGESAAGPAQVFELNVDTGARRQLTNHPLSVLRYDYHGGRRIAYLAEIQPDWRFRRERGYVVGTEPFGDVVGKGLSQQYASANYFIADVDTGRVTNVREAPLKLWGDPRFMWGPWLSPSGRWAVAVRRTKEPPSNWWTEYRPIAQIPYLQQVRSLQDKDFIDQAGPHFQQFVLIDAQTGESRALLDAPTGQGYGGPVLAAHWPKDESRVLLANTFLPLGVSSASEDERRKESPAIVAVDLMSGSSSRILDLQSTGIFRGNYRGSHLRVDGTLTVSLERFEASAATGAPSFKRYAYRNIRGAWTEVQEDANARASIRISVVQGLNQPPQLLAQDENSGLAKVISRFNPQLRELSMGSVETKTWRDSSGRLWGGLLLRPVNYEEGRRYPLVIQTNGRYSSTEFFVDGPQGITSGHAARALANRGMVVLQVPDEPIDRAGLPALVYRDEYPARIDCYRSAIDALEKEGLIDTDRVGIHGFSRTGYFVQHALTFSDLRFAAASVADPSELSVYSSVNFYGLPFPGMLEVEQMIGQSLWSEESARTWAEKDPSFHLHRMRAPLLIQTYSFPHLWWDVFTLLRRNKFPVEMISIPDGAHVLFKPWERLSAQEAIVDWYDFWLNQHEDTDPAKAEQYLRWRVLRLKRNEMNRSMTSRPNHGEGLSRGESAQEIAAKTMAAAVSERCSRMSVAT